MRISDLHSGTCWFINSNSMPSCHRLPHYCSIATCIVHIFCYHANSGLAFVFRLTLHTERKGTALLKITRSLQVDTGLRQKY